MSAAFLELAKESKVLVVCLGSYASFTLKQCAGNDKTLRGRFSKDDCSGLFSDHPLTDVQKLLDNIEFTMFDSHKHVYSKIPDFDPSLDSLCQALLHDKAADGSHIKTVDAAVPYLLQMAVRFCTFLDACVAFTRNHDRTKRYTESMEDASHYAWLRVRTSFQTWKLSAVAELMHRHAWFDTFRHYVYGYSLPSTDVPNNCSLVKIGYTHSKIEFYAAYKYNSDRELLPCSLKQYAENTALEKSMLVEEKISRVLAVAQRFDGWKSGRLLFLFGPFPTKIAAVHAEHHIRSLSGALMDPDVIAQRMSGDAKKSGKGDFVSVPNKRLEKFEELNLHCGRSFMQDTREVLETLMRIITK